MLGPGAMGCPGSLDGTEQSACCPFVICIRTQNHRIKEIIIYQRMSVHYTGYFDISMCRHARGVLFFALGAFRVVY